MVYENIFYILLNDSSMTGQKSFFGVNSKDTSSDITFRLTVKSGFSLKMYLTKYKCDTVTAFLQ